MSLPRHPRALLLLPRRPTTITTTAANPPPPPIPLTANTATSSPALRRAAFSTTPQRGADIIRRPRRPYTFTQLVQLSDGSTYTARTTSPHAVYKSTKDARNHVLWQPRERTLRNVEVDEAGKLAAFRGRFGTVWDADAAGPDSGGPDSASDSASARSAADDQEVKELMERRGGLATRKLRLLRRQMDKRQADRGAADTDADAGAEGSAEGSASASESGGREGLSDLISKYSSPQSQSPSDRAPVVRKKK
ncbi:hypothetical protein F4775DRAFT_553248 [Biscogniauxia sp. FL1348]|nr:hypothetical protein F4775DRAFT_553248 [Biscogniauxia sp. FL1348]